MSGISARRVAWEALLIVSGSVIFAVGVDCFEIPYGLAAGGVTGLATVFSAIAANMGVTLPVGIQTILMNVLLMLVVVRTGSKGYVARTVAGILCCGFFTDALVPFLPVVGGEGDLLLCALWGGVITGVGLGLVFRAGGNTGGTDIVAQLLARRPTMPLGTAIIIVDGAVIAFSATVFSVEQALYAAVAMFICGKVIDAAADGPRTSRAAYIITDRYKEVERKNPRRPRPRLHRAQRARGVERPGASGALLRAEPLGDGAPEGDSCRARPQRDRVHLRGARGLRRGLQANRGVVPEGRPAHSPAGMEASTRTTSPTPWLMRFAT